MFSSPLTARRSRRRAPIAAALGLALVLWLSGCGDSNTAGAPEASPSAQTGSGDGDAGRVRLAQCLRSNGVDVPDDVGAGGMARRSDLDLERIQELLRGACAQEAAGAFGDAPGGDPDAFRDAFAIYAQCMRENGVDLPDLPADGSLPDLSGIDRGAPSFQRAREACASKLPQGLPGGAR